MNFQEHAHLDAMKIYSCQVIVYPCPMKYSNLFVAVFALTVASSCSQPDDPDQLSNCTTKLISEVSDPQRDSDTLLTVCDELTKSRSIDKVGFGEPHEHESSWFSTFLEFATVFAAICGLVFLRKTFQAADKTANAAINADSALMLCSVEFELVTACVFRKNLTDEQKCSILHYIKPKITVGNYGRTPARDVHIKLLLHPMTLSNWVPEPAKQIGLQYRHPIFKAGDKEEIDLNPKVVGKVIDPDYEVYIIFAELTYKSVFDYPEKEPRMERLEFAARVHMGRVQLTPSTRTYFPSTASSWTTAFDVSIDDKYIKEFDHKKHA